MCNIEHHDGAALCSAGSLRVSSCATSSTTSEATLYSVVVACGRPKGAGQTPTSATSRTAMEASIPGLAYGIGEPKPAGPDEPAHEECPRQDLLEDSLRLPDDEIGVGAKGDGLATPRASTSRTDPSLSASGVSSGDGRDERPSFRHSRFALSCSSLLRCR